MKFEGLKAGLWCNVPFSDLPFRKIVAIEGGIVIYTAYDKEGKFSFVSHVRQGTDFINDWKKIGEPLFTKKPEVIENQGVFYCRVDNEGTQHSEYCLTDFLLNKCCYSHGFNSLKETKEFVNGDQKIFKVKFSVKATEVIEGVNDD